MSANDVANSFGRNVGSGILTFKEAVILDGIFETAKKNLWKKFCGLQNLFILFFVSSLKLKFRKYDATTKLWSLQSDRIIWKFYYDDDSCKYRTLFTKLFEDFQ